MAETPDYAYHAVRSLPAAARVILTVLYRHVTRDAVLGHEAGGPAPWTFVGVKKIIELSGVGRTQVYDHMRALEKLGAVRPETREPHDGWVLPLLPSTTSDSEGRQQHGSESGSPDDIEGDESGRPDDRVRQTGRPEGPQSGGPDETVRRAGRDSPAGRTRQSGGPDENRYVNNNSNMIINKTTAAAVVVSLDRRARELVEQLAVLFHPDEPGRRFSPSNPRHLEIAREVLAVHVHPGEDAERLADDRFSLVHNYVSDFAKMCAANVLLPRPVREWWGPLMLSTVPRPGKSKSAWECLMKSVDDWRLGNRRQQAEAEAEQGRAAEAARRAEQEVREAAEVAARRTPHEDVAAAVASAPFMRREDPRAEEATRRSGAAREIRDELAEVREIEIQRRVNAELCSAMSAKGEMGLTRSEVAEITRRARGESR